MKHSSIETIQSLLLKSQSFHNPIIHALLYVLFFVNSATFCVVFFVTTFSAISTQTKVIICNSYTCNIPLKYRPVAVFKYGSNGFTEL